MDNLLGPEWQIEEIKGDTGKAFVGLRKNEKVFIKRNTTPMLAALSAEGIAPKLVWTKRDTVGDIYSAQEWLEGELLRPNEMGQRNDVIDVLYQLHHSKELSIMLSKIGGATMTPEKMLLRYEEQLPEELRQSNFLTLVHDFLRANKPDFHERQAVVVHGDVNCRNWLVSSNYLYLVDWDNVMFADPALDIGTLLGNYVPRCNWSKCLSCYGMQGDIGQIEKIYWYALMSIMQEVKKYSLRQNQSNMNEEIVKLKRIFS